MNAGHEKRDNRMRPYPRSKLPGAYHIPGITESEKNGQNLIFYIQSFPNVRGCKRQQREQGT
jgi:hypothetical protein